MEENSLYGDDIMVSIKCLAYNQETMIGDALEGFVKQQTNFRFEVFVQDDASTDGTAAVIRKYAEAYPDIIHPIYQKENIYNSTTDCPNNYILPYAKGKYMALCEGDDYWIDPLKLQKQVDYMESHPECSLCYTLCINSNGKILGKDNARISLYYRYSVPTCTSLFRLSDYKAFLQSPLMLHNVYAMGDTPLWAFLCNRGEAYILPEVTSYYRVLAQSASHWTDKKLKMRFRSSEFNCKIDHVLCSNLTDREKRKVVEFVTRRCIQEMLSDKLQIAASTYQRLERYYKGKCSYRYFLLKCVMQLFPKYDENA